MRRFAPLGVLSVLFAVADARADEPAPPGLVRPVTVTIAGDSDPRATEATLRDLFAHLPIAGASSTPEVTLDVTVSPEIASGSITDPPASPTPAFARVWIDMRSDTCLVSIADASWERIYQRRMARPPGSDDVTREQVAQVVVSAVEAMLAGGTIGVARAELAPAVKPPPRASRPVRERPPSPAPRPPGPSANLGLGYEALAYASSTLAHGPSASLRGALPFGGWRLGVELAGQWRAPLVVDRAPIGVRLDMKAVRLLGYAERELSPQLAVRAGLGPGVDVIEIEPRALGEGAPSGQTITVEGKRSRVTPVLRGSLALDARVARSVHVVVAGVLDHALQNRAFVVRRQGSDEPVLAPFALRPGLTLSLVGDLVSP